MLGTKKPEDVRNAPPRRSRGPLIARAAFAAVVVIGAVIAVMAGGGDGAGPVAATSSTVAPTTAAPEPETTTTALSGPALEGAAGVAGFSADAVGGGGTRPDRIVFGDDGTFEVIDQFRTVDTGVYTTSGGEIAFESDPREYHEWYRDDINTMGRKDCTGIVGTYTVTWETSTRFVLDVVGDGCPRRLTPANGLVLEIEQVTE